MICIGYLNKDVKKKDLLPTVIKYLLITYLTEYLY